MAQPSQERMVAQLEKPEQTAGNVGQAGSGTQPENQPHYEDHGDDHTHHVGMPQYYSVFALLMVFLFLTVGAWYIDQHVHSLGHFSAPIALAIAVVKATMIVLIFMHVKFSSRLVQIFACTGVAFVFILFLLSANDYGTRPWSPMSDTMGLLTARADSQGGSNISSPPIIRSSFVGSSPNAQSTPADNTIGSAATSPGNATQTAIDGARDRPATAQGVVNGGSMPAQPGSGTRGATDMNTALQDPNSVVNRSGAASSNTTSTVGRGGNGQTQGGGQTSLGAANSSSGRMGDTVTTGHNQAGAAAGAGMNGGKQDLGLNGSTNDNGSYVGGAANNSYGSSDQAQGIQPADGVALKTPPPTGAMPTLDGVWK